MGRGSKVSAIFVAREEEIRNPKRKIETFLDKESAACRKSSEGLRFQLKFRSPEIYYLGGV